MARSAWYYREFGLRLQQEMKAKGLTIQALAAQTGASEGAIYKWLKGDRLPDDKHRAALCAALGRTEEWLLSVGSPTLTNELFAEKLVAVLNRVMVAGQSAPEALEAETGAANLLTPEQRRDAAAATPALRATVRELLAKMGSQMWDQLSREEKVALSQELARLVEAETSGE